MKISVVMLGQRLKIILCPLLTAFLLMIDPTSACSQTKQSSQQEKMTRRDINIVLRDHDQDLLAIPGVVGVFVGLLPDGTTLCLKVMVVKETEDLKKIIPQSIEGYPVLIEESGVIRPQ